MDDMMQVVGVDLLDATDLDGGQSYVAVGATVSVGVASDTEVDADLSALFRRADAALYVAKRGGAQSGRASRS